MSTMNYRVAFGQLLKTNLKFLLALFLGVLLPLLIFGKLWDRVHSGGGVWWDESIMRYIHSYATPELDMLVLRLTIIGGIVGVPILVGMALLLRFLANRPVSAFFFATSISGAWLLNIVAKLTFQRVRPELWDSPLPEADYSFPSGHAMLSMALATALLLLIWPTRLRWPAIICAIPCVMGISISRLYLGVHYPSDIAAGWCAALLWVCGLYVILFKWIGQGEIVVTTQKLS
jgi:membrane-associated phospholipid phosphatase